MSRNEHRIAAAYSLAGLAFAALVAPAAAQTTTATTVANTTASNVNTLNLLSPFLNLNATPAGQATLSGTLSGALALNRFAAANPGIAAISISDKAIFGGATGSITLANGTSRSFGPGANLAGGLPLQAVQAPGTIAPFQQYGGLGTLGTAFQAAVAPGSATAPAAATLLSTAYSFASSDLGVAKNYFANGTIEGLTTAVAPAGLTLPTANGYPNRLTSVYDTAFGVSNTQPGQGIYGDSRPVQVSNAFTPYDPTALTGLTTNPSFPSGHTTYAFTDSMLIGMAVPQFYQSMLLRASEYGQSRNELGVHYTLDIIASRGFVAYDLAQMLTATDPAYLRTNAVAGATPTNFNTQFQAAAQGLNAYLNTQTASCGGTLAACAANNPYNTFSAQTYGGQPFVTNPGTGTDATNAAIYAGRLTQGLPTLSFAQAPREQAPAGGADASILLATVYGGSTAQAQALAASVGGPLYGNLSTGTINQIIVNTETNALAAFYGTALSYWTRINLYDAVGYFGNVTGALALDPGDRVNRAVTVGNTGVLSGSGTINGNLVVQSGGALATVGNGMTTTAPLQVNGSTALQAGSAVKVSGLVLPGQSYKIVNGTGPIAVDPGVRVDLSSGTGLVPTFAGTLVVAGDPGLSVAVRSGFAGLAQSGNGRAVGAALDAGGNAGGYGTAGQALLSGIVAGNTAASVPGLLAVLSGEGIAGQQQAAFNATELVASTVLDVARSGVTADSMVQMGRRRVWATGFGQSASLEGRQGAGSASWSGSLAGFAAGTDYRLDSGLLLGIAGAYSDSQFSVGGRGTAGSATAGHVALYALQRFGAAYVTGVFDAGFFDNRTSRAGLGTVQTGSFGATEVLGRVEGGYAIPLAPVTLTPYGGVQIAGLYNDGFNEGGAGNAGLSVASRSVGSQKVYLGGQVDTTQAFAGVTLTPYARLAWEHEFTTGRTVAAGFQSLPGAGFTVSGAPAASDAARISAGAKLNMGSGFGAYVAFDGSFSGVGNTYAGKGGIRYAW